ncbi:MAG TPA: ferric reductase-like transmembrane domain-containing protein [Patescibacteria group bacterium]|nr:ferric reductase-like transmembrane domain-containing protein [Patescibacteria group bacterium]
MFNKRLAQTGLLAVYTAALYLPPYIFFHDRGGTVWLHSLTLKSGFRLLFPLLGLYAFTFVTWQILINTNLRWLRPLWPNILNFHRFEGGFALLFALLHPFFITLGFGLMNELHLRFVANPQKWWLIPGITGVTILICTVGTALLAWRGMNIPWWRKLHRLNYLVFALVWLHSWFIGTDTRTPLLRKVWIIYLLAVLLSTFGKYYPKLRQLFEPKGAHA